MTDNLPPSPHRPRGLPDARGFTLLELLIAIVIIGILAAVSFTGLNGYRERAYHAAVKTDLRNALSAEEGYFADNGSYLAFSVTDGGTVTPPDFTASKAVTITATVVAAGLRLEGSHSAASGTGWCLSTATGRLVEGTGC